MATRPTSRTDYEVLQRVYSYADKMMLLTSLARDNEFVLKEDTTLMFFSTSEWEMETIEPYFAVFGKVKSVSRNGNAFQLTFAKKETADLVVRVYQLMYQEDIYKSAVKIAQLGNENWPSNQVDE